MGHIRTQYDTQGKMSTVILRSSLPSGDSIGLIEEWGISARLLVKCDTSPSYLWGVIGILAAVKRASENVT
jgi:hypothetical protein